MSVRINSLQKTSGQFENSVFEIRATREIARLIARCPYYQVKHFENTDPVFQKQG